MKRRTNTEARIEHVCGMMRRLEWRTGESGPELAQAWGLSRSSVEKYAAEASRRVRAELSDPAEVQRLTGAALAKVLHEASQDGDRRNVIRAAAELARIFGAVAPARHEISGHRGGEIRIMGSVEIPAEISDAEYARQHPTAGTGVRRSASVRGVELLEEIPDGASARSARANGFARA